MWLDVLSKRNQVWQQIAYLNLKEAGASALRQLSQGCGFQDTYSWVSDLGYLRLLKRPQDHLTFKHVQSPYRGLKLRATRRYWPTKIILFIQGWHQLLRTSSPKIMPSQGWFTFNACLKQEYKGPATSANLELWWAILNPTVSWRQPRHHSPTSPSVQSCLSSLPSAADDLVSVRDFHNKCPAP